MIEQGTEEWFKERMGYCTASQFHHVLAKGAGKGRKDYMKKLLAERLTGESTEGFTNADIKRGIELEPYAKMAYTAFTGNIIEDVGFQKHKDHLIMAGYSPDGNVKIEGHVEIKCVKETVQLATIKDSINVPNYCPKEHIAQIQGGMWVTGRKWCDFISFSPKLPENLRLFVSRVNRDDAEILYIERDVKQFLKELDQEELFYKSFIQEIAQ